MADPSFTAIQLVVVATLSQKLGWSFYEELRKNDIMIVQSHEQIYDTVKRGERLVAAEASDPRIYTGGQAPPNLINIIPRNGAIEVPSPTAIVKGSPHPNAARLFAQFNLTPDIQHKFTEEGHHSPRVDVAPPPGLPRLDELTLYPADYDYIEKNTKQIKAKFADIFQ
jgi:iron(III) transport system substrate-binding protein